MNVSTQSARSISNLKKSFWDAYMYISHLINKEPCIRRAHDFEILSPDQRSKNFTEEKKHETLFLAFKSTGLRNAFEQVAKQKGFEFSYYKKRSSTEPLYNKIILVVESVKIPEAFIRELDIHRKRPSEQLQGVSMSSDTSLERIERQRDILGMLRKFHSGLDVLGCLSTSAPKDTQCVHFDYYDHQEATRVRTYLETYGFIANDHLSDERSLCFNLDEQNPNVETIPSLELDLEERTYASLSTVDRVALLKWLLENKYESTVTVHGNHTPNTDLSTRICVPKPLHSKLMFWLGNIGIGYIHGGRSQKIGFLSIFVSMSQEMDAFLKKHPNLDVRSVLEKYNKAEINLKLKTKKENIHMSKTNEEKIRHNFYVLAHKMGIQIKIDYTLKIDTDNGLTIITFQKESILAKVLKSFQKSTAAIYKEAVRVEMNIVLDNSLHKARVEHTDKKSLAEKARGVVSLIAATDLALKGRGPGKDPNPDWEYATTIKGKNVVVSLRGRAVYDSFLRIIQTKTTAFFQTAQENPEDLEIIFNSNLYGPRKVSTGKEEVKGAQNEMTPTSTLKSEVLSKEKKFDFDNFVEVIEILEQKGLCIVRKQDIAQSETKTEAVLKSVTFKFMGQEMTMSGEKIISSNIETSSQAKEVKPLTPQEFFEL